ncbi:hypothetical protein Hanom_Chr02g00155371 [Helianthus anomalus]
MFVEHSYGTSTPVTFKDLKIKNLGLHNMLLIEENKNLKAMRFDTKTKSKKPYVLSFLIAIAILLYLLQIPFNQFGLLSYLVFVTICKHLL